MGKEHCTKCHRVHRSTLNMPSYGVSSICQYNSIRLVHNLDIAYTICKSEVTNAPSKWSIILLVLHKTSRNYAIDYILEKWPH